MNTGAYPTLEDGWYLMSTEDLELELARWRTADESLPRSRAARISTDEALAFRNAGNLPDEHGRTLRLVLRVEAPADPEELARKRLEHEPDYHEAPRWRREGSRPVNVVPLRPKGSARRAGPWWEMPGVKELEEEWRATGRVAGVKVPSEYRGFVFKTVLALRASGKDVTADSIADSIARWLPDDEAERVRLALREDRAAGSRRDEV